MKPPKGRKRRLCVIGESKELAFMEARIKQAFPDKAQRLRYVRSLKKDFEERLKDV